MFSRRTFLQSTALAGAVLPFSGRMFASEKPTEKPAIVHLTDLFHPHGDLDDHFDLACVFSLAYQGLIDLKGIVLDYPPPIRKGDPDVMAVAQMNRICGMNVPYVVGTSRTLSHRKDSLPDLTPQDSFAIRWIIDLLRTSEKKIVFSCVGTTTDLAVAVLREPELFREKCAGIYLHAGSSQGSPPNLEFNVKLNPAGYATMFDVPCPLYWFPCWHKIRLRQSDDLGTFYWMPHKDAFEGVDSPALRGYFMYMYKQSEDPRWLRAILTPPSEEDWNEFLTKLRPMWGTGGILLMSGLNVAPDGTILSANDSNKQRIMRMDPVLVDCEDNGRLSWEYAEEESRQFIFRNLDPANYPAALTRALRSLLLAIPKEVGRSTFNDT